MLAILEKETTALFIQLRISDNRRRPRPSCWPRGTQRPAGFAPTASHRAAPFSNRSFSCFLFLRTFHAPATSRLVQLLSRETGSCVRFRLDFKFQEKGRTLTLPRGQLREHRAARQSPSSSA